MSSKTVWTCDMCSCEMPEPGLSRVGDYIVSQYVRCHSGPESGTDWRRVDLCLACREQLRKFMERYKKP